jgi:hypothetical protein
MTPATIIELADVPGKPKAKLDLPSPLRIGDKVRLHFRLTRQTGGRPEVLDVSGEYQIRSVGFDTSEGVARQLLSVETTGVAPSWKAVKKTSLPPPRKMGPARAPRMHIE